MFVFIFFLALVSELIWPRSYLWDGWGHGRGFRLNKFCLLQLIHKHTKWGKKLNLWTLDRKGIGKDFIQKRACEDSWVEKICWSEWKIGFLWNLHFYYLVHFRNCDGLKILDQSLFWKYIFNEIFYLVSFFLSAAVERRPLCRNSRDP